MKKICSKVFSFVIIISLLFCSKNVDAKSNVVSQKQEFQDETYIITIKSNENMVIDIDGASKENQANVHIWEYKGEIQQKFQLEYDNEGFYTIRNLYSGKVLDVEWGGMTSGTNVWQYEDNNSASQKWTIKKADDGYYYIVSKLNGLYLNIENNKTTNGANVQVAEFDDSDSQKFNLCKVEGLEGSKTIENGEYKIATALDKNMVVDIAGASKENQANANLWEYKGEIQQKFKIQYDESGYYTIINLNSGKVLDAEWGGITTGTNVWQYEDNGSDSQKWIIKETSDGYYNIISKLNGLYLDVANGSTNNGTNIQLFGKNESDAQKFLIKDISLIKGSQTIEDGNYEIVTALKENMVIDISNASKENQANADIWEFIGQSQQKFKIEYDGLGYYKIVNINSGKVLDAAWGGMTSGTNVWQYEDNGTDSQKWVIQKTSDGYYNIISKLNGLYIDITNGDSSNGTNVQLYEGNGSDAQKFNFDNLTYIPSNQILDNGTYRIASTLSYNQILESQDDLDNPNLKIWKNEGRSNQRFSLEYVGDGYYKIRVKASNKVLTVKDDNPNVGTLVYELDDNDLDTQKWILNKQSEGIYTIISKCKNLYLDIENSNPQNGQQVYLNKDTGLASQQFIFVNETPSASINIQNGVYQIALANNMVLDIDGGKNDNSANLQIWNNDRVQQQKFHITRIENTNYYKIISVNSAKAIDVQGGISDIGTNVDQYEQNGTDNQYWYFKDCGNGYYNIISKANGLCLDIAGGITDLNGANVQLFYNNGTEGQKFKFIPINIIDNNTYEMETKLDANIVLDVSNASQDNYANIQLWTADNVDQQRFIFEAISTDTYVIRAKHSNKALTVDLSNNNVCQMDYTGASNQQWRIQEAGYGYYNLISLANNLYLDVSNGNAQNGQNIQVYSDNESDAQQFRFVTGYRKFYEEGTYGTSGKRQSGQGGYDLTYYKIGKGSKHLFTTFSIHGFEDSYWKDGSELTYMANQLKDYLYNNLSEDLINEWTIYIFPTLNPDGQYDGWTNNGPGRTTVYSNAPNNQGIDMNRGFSVGFQRMTSARNYTGTAAFQAPEAAQLRDFILAHQGSSNVLIDVHGWLNETIGDDGIGSYYRSEFGISKHIGTYGNGYLVNWARSIPNTRSMLLELPNVTSHAQVVNWDYAGKFNRATMRLLNDF